jgi:hypothetical protein
LVLQEPLPYNKAELGIGIETNAARIGIPSPYSGTGQLQASAY